jgi:hypothetical protein
MGSVVLIVGCLSNGPWGPCSSCRVRRLACGTQAFRCGTGSGGWGGRGGWWRPEGGRGPGRVGWGAVGPRERCGAVSRSALPPTPCGAPPGVGEERQVVAPRGWWVARRSGHGAGRRAPLRCASLRAVRNPVAGKATGARIRSSRGEGGSFGGGSRSSGTQRAGVTRPSDPGITTASASPRSPSPRTRPPARPRRPPSWRRPRSRSGCRRRR